MPRRFALAAALAALLGGAAGCAGPAARLAWPPDELRAEVVRRAPGIAPADVVVPFELGVAERAKARAIVGTLESSEEKVRALVAAMMDPERLGLRYASRVTGDAAETMRVHEGNCLALASVFVALAREVGLEAYYIDASTRVHDTIYAPDGLTVTEGHVTAMVVTPGGKVGLDFARLGRVVWYRVLDDVEALAHFYNNRGYERIDEARERGAAVDWALAAADFRRATEVSPEFARAWNNLGMAEAALGRDGEAAALYREAIRRDPELGAPRNNLGVLLLRQGDPAGARKVLEAAARLPASGPHVLYNLALARSRDGDREGAIEAARRARAAGYPRAQHLVDELAAAPSSDAPAMP